MEPLVNRVAQSSLITIKPEDFYPKFPIVEFDLKDYLFHGLILKEIEFRQNLKDLDWSKFKDCCLTIYCSTDAIIPTWAYMLVASYAQKHALDVCFGNKSDCLNAYFRERIRNLTIDPYVGAKVVIKGCSDLEIPPAAYLELTRKLQPVVASIMYGEPCSTVPVYKQSKTQG